MSPVASYHLPGLHSESSKAISKLSDMMIASHLQLHRYQSRKNIIFNQLQIVSHPSNSITQEKYTFNQSTLSETLGVELCNWLSHSVSWPSPRCKIFDHGDEFSRTYKWLGMAVPKPCTWFKYICDLIPCWRYRPISDPSSLLHRHQHNHSHCEVSKENI